MDVLELIAPQQNFKCPPLEVLLTSPDYFGLITASPLQRAICRTLDGVSLDELQYDKDVIEALGGEAAVADYETLVASGASAIGTIVLLAGIRSAKSLIAACAIVRSALTCDMSPVKAGEPMPRASVVSTSKDTAQPTWDHIHGHIIASPILSKRLVGKPTANSLVLRHENGLPVEVTVVAGARGASTLVARWSAGVIFDEAPRMVGEDEGVVNLDHARQSIAGRMLPGAPVILSGSSWAPFGPVYNLVAEHHGKPSTEILVIRAKAAAMNPVHWTPERCAELRKRDPDAARVDLDTEFLDPESGLLSHSEIEACAILEGDVAPQRGHYYAAAIDPATRGNAWTVIILGRRRDDSLFVAAARQWVGSISTPLSPLTTFAEIQELCKPYAITTLHSDEWSADANVDLAAVCNLWLISHKTTAPMKLENALRARNLITDRKLDLPSNVDLRRDLAGVRKRTTSTGVTIHYPVSAGNRHCDYAAALFLALQYAPPAPDSEESILNAVEAERIKNDEALAAKEAARLEVLRNVAAQNKAMRWK